MEGLKFEAALARLEEIVEKLESGELDLESSITVFQEGITLSLFCQKELQKAEGKIQQLVESMNGELIMQDMDDVL